MKRRKVIQKLQREAKARSLEFRVIELTNHTAIQVGNITKTIGRHTEIPDKTVIKFYEQFSDVLGRGWWR